jgi:hypothetical protein
MNKKRDAAEDRATPVQPCAFRDVDAVNLAIALRDGNAFTCCQSTKKVESTKKVGSSVENDSDDNFYRACIVIVPHAGVFYCHRERRSLSTGVLNSHIPMDINWLQLQCDAQGNCFGKGSYVSRLANQANECSIWKWSIRRSASNLLPFPNAIMGLLPRSGVRSVHHTTQLTDEEGPALPPDFIVGEEDDILSAADCSTRKSTFQDAFSRSTSAKLGGRHYAPGFLHRTIDPKFTFVIDPQMYGELDLLVYVTIPSTAGGAVPFRRISVVQIRYLPNVVGTGCEELLTDINNHCMSVRKERGGTGVRAGNGDLGAMHPIGNRVDKDWRKVPYVTSSNSKALPLLSAAVQAAAKLASATIPASLRVMQDFESDSGITHAKGMGDGGICRVTHSMDLSVNLANSSHYDVNDASQGFTIWTEDHCGTKHWYFVLPNMRGKFPGTDREYNGIAIKLSHGVLIGWDGRLIRHGTSVTASQVGNVYGTFFAAKTRLIKYGMSQLP